MALNRGVDIVIGTCGRVIDLMEKGILNLRYLKYFILDEADEMLNMGFRDDIEKVFQNTPTQGLQTLLYSATIPDWVRSVASKYLQPDYVIVDLVGSSDNVQTSVGVTHLAIQTDHHGRLAALADVIGVYSKGGKSMIFCDTKKDCNELALSSSIAADCQTLHGDIAQTQREITLSSFREGIFKILVCTDVAARGLDINDVDLVVQCAPPKDVETYIHRSGRTGRAGKTGACITFYTKKEEQLLRKIEKTVNVKLERTGMPQKKEIYLSSARVSLDQIEDVDEDISQYFMDFVKSQVLPAFKGNAELALANCFCVMGGHNEKISDRSLLTSAEGQTAILAYPTGERFYDKNDAMSVLSRELRSTLGNVNLYELRMTKDGGAIFDLKFEDAKYLLEKNEGRFNFSKPTQLPDLVEEINNYGRGGYNRGGNGYRGRGGYNNNRGYNNNNRGYSNNSYNNGGYNGNSGGGYNSNWSMNSGSRY